MKRTRKQKEEQLLKAAGAVIKEFLDWEEQADRPSLRQIEDVVLGLREQLGQCMAAVAIGDQDAKQPAEAPICPTCGEAMRYKGQKGTAVASRIGSIDMDRGHYYCARCHSGLFPPGPPT
jgi:hypothetical protein